MAEQAAIFRRVIFRQRCNLLRTMTVVAEFFRLYFSHILEPLMVFIMGQVRSRFRGGAPEKEKQSAAGEQKDNIIDNGIFFSSHGIAVQGVEFKVF
jgi:hypothetical protein